MHAIIFGYVSGNDYLKSNEFGSLAWAIGVMNGIMATSTMIEKEANGPWLPDVSLSLLRSR